jgi:hypothetical protein
VSGPALTLAETPGRQHSTLLQPVISVVEFAWDLSCKPGSTRTLSGQCSLGELRIFLLLVSASVSVSAVQALALAGAESNTRREKTTV